MIGTSLRKALFKEFAHQHKPFKIGWNRPDQAVADLRQLIENFLDESDKEPWIVAWCAGRGGFASTTFELEHELVYLSVVLDELANSKNNNGLFFSCIVSWCPVHERKLRGIYRKQSDKYF